MTRTGKLVIVALISSLGIAATNGIYVSAQSGAEWCNVPGNTTQGIWKNVKRTGQGGTPTQLGNNVTGVYRVTNYGPATIQFSTQKSATNTEYVAVLGKNQSADLAIMDTLQVEVTQTERGRACGTYTRVSN